MLRYIKKFFFTAITFLRSAVLNVDSLECVSMNNQECKVRSEIINLNTNESLLYLYSVKINKCKGSCNTINDPYDKICVLDNIKNTNVKVFNLILKINETRHIESYIRCTCKCRLDASVCNNKQRRSEYKCRCECKEIIDRGFIWNPSNCECECDKSCDIGEY